MDILQDEARIIRVDSKDECDRCDICRPSQSTVRVDRAAIIVKKALLTNLEIEPIKLCEDCYNGWRIYQLGGQSI